MMAETFGPLGNAKYSEYQGDIHSAAAHLLNIVNEVLDIARIEAGEADPADRQPWTLPMSPVLPPS